MTGTRAAAKAMVLALLGDVMLGRGVGAEIERRAPESFWGDTLPVLQSADLVIANLECAVTASAIPWTRTPKVFHFRAPPRAVDVLRAARVRLVSLANNHILDFEEQGLRDTIRSLDAAGIAHAGAGVDAEAASAPAVVEAGGIRVGLVAFTDNEPGWAAGPSRPGINYLEIRPEPAALDRVERAVGRAREVGAQFVVLSLHWGPNMVQRSPLRFHRFAHAAVGRGMDLVYGHSAHVFQGIELHRPEARAGRPPVPILYDTGDFLDDYAVDPFLRNDQSLIFLAGCGEAARGDRGVRGLRMVPVRLRFAEVNRAVGPDLEAICSRMRDFSAELGTRVERVNDMLQVMVQ